jgi:transposase
MKIDGLGIAAIEASDSRRISLEALHDRHIQYVRFRTSGMSNNQASAVVGFCPETGSRIWKKYLALGLGSLKPANRGVPKGCNRALSKEQEESLQETLKNHTPDELGLPYLLWSREAVKRLISEKYIVELALRTMTLYFQRWGFTYQRPARRAYRQNQETVQRWLTEEYPSIKEEASREKAEIFWCDETGITNETNSKRGFSPRGQTPVLKVEVKQRRVNMISALTNQGKLRFMLYMETMTTVLLIMFLQRLIREAGHKIYVIMDNLRVHHSKKFEEWVKANGKKIKVYYLPSYSPELNPDEYLNGRLKQDIHSGISPRTSGEISKRTRWFMQRHQRTPDNVKKLFKHKRVLYAS